ncbi:MAG: class I fructose-bisphosphate aldolase [Hyphomicrobiaceae bacterium]
MAQSLADIAQALVAPGKGILAADESTGTIQKRFDSIKVANTETNRRDYREMLFRATDALQNYISGVILFEETLRQKAKDGTPLVQLIAEAGAIPGIKVDTGAKTLAGSKIEKIAEGLDGLRERLAAYSKLGARFAKWRAAITIADDCPSWNCINANAHALARYAALCQEAGLVPIVEPEVLMDGEYASHNIDQCYVVTEWTLKTVFEELYDARVDFEGIVLKPNMVVAGQKSSKQASPQEVAERTLHCLKTVVPPAVPGIAFLSGGQSDEQATEHLQLMNAIGNVPWRLTFSYGRALQAAALKAWGGKAENIAAARQAFAHRAEMNGLAARGQWSRTLET